MVTDIDAIKNLHRLLPEECAEIADLYYKWESARQAKDWQHADELRKQYAEWDSTLPTDGTWHPFFESNQHWKQRVFKRMKKYKIAIYPFTLTDLEN